LLPSRLDLLQDPVEDTKGNNGDQGELRITNLRIMWISKKSRRTNISIGFNTVTSVTTKNATSRLKGWASLAQGLT
jgi:Bardet-Biedl syndrome 5 protein